jgi:glycosyltransferase involved in cell wall biosynthesis
VGLVSVLQQQAAALDITYEILVADDASPDQDAIRINRAINELPHCRYIVKEQNSGSAATRNYLGARSRYHWLLFMDCDIDIPDDRFLERYVKDEHEGVINGGICIADDDRLRHNLRYLYEKAAEGGHTAEKRQQKPYKDFHTSNFMIRRDLMLAHPFDERFRRYGYEDVLFGKTLRQHGIRIEHIDNPVGFDSFEENLAFVEKTEEGLHTLYEFSNELRGYNYLLTFVNGIHLGFVKAAIRLWHRLFGPIERHRLAGRHPNLTIFKIYKLGYYLSLTKKN